MSRPLTFTRCPPGEARGALQPGRWPDQRQPRQVHRAHYVGCRRTCDEGAHYPPLRPDQAHLEDSDGS